MSRNLRSHSPMIRLDNISKHHGHQLLFIEASMVLQKGGKVGLVGSNGAGKSTIFRMIAGQFAQVQMQDAALGLLTVLAGVPRGWGSMFRESTPACANTGRALARRLRDARLSLSWRKTPRRGPKRS